MEGEQVVQEDASNAAPLPQRVIPLPWEDLPSLISRVARKMGYERPEWILRPEALSHSIAPSTLPLLRRRADYQLLKRLLLLEEEQLFSLTLHRFTHRFEALPCPPPQTNPDFLASIERTLPRHVQFFRSEPETQVCPLCLDNPDGYDRLYWRCSYVLLCARHRIYLVDHCPACRAPIPGLRRSHHGITFGFFRISLSFLGSPHLDIYCHFSAGPFPSRRFLHAFLQPCYIHRMYCFNACCSTICLPYGLLTYRCCLSISSVPC